MKSYCNSISLIPPPRMALVGPFSCRWGWGRGAGGRWGKGSLEKAVGVSPAIFCLQLPSGAPKKEAAVCYWACRRGREWGGCWGVQLANGLRLMKWIMRGARTDFCAKKGDGRRSRCTLTCSGLICQELTPCQEDKDQRIRRLGQHLLPRQPSWGFLSSSSSSLTSIEIIWAMSYAK